MLTRLDRYIISKYLSTFFFTVVIFSLISIIIDISQKLEDFIENSLSFSDIVFKYYLNWMPFMNGLLWPLYALIAVIFFTSRLAYNSEIISILNAGVSYRRFMRPYLLGALLIAGIHLLGNHYIIPKTSKSLGEFEQQMLKKNQEESKLHNIHFYIGPNEKVFIQNWIKRDSVARKFRVERFVDNKLIYLLKAKELKWIGPPNKWKIKDYEIRTFDGNKETLSMHRKDQTDTTFNIKPSDLVRFSNDKQRMTTKELQAFINQERSRGVGRTKQLETEVHRRSADACTVIILTLIGMAVASRKVRGGMGLHLAIGASIGALYILFGKFSIAIASTNVFPPVLAVWIPNILFGFVALFLISRAQK